MAYLLPGRENCCWLTANLYSFNCIFFSSFWVVKIKKTLPFNSMPGHSFTVFYFLIHTSLAFELVILFQSTSNSTTSHVPNTCEIGTGCNYSLHRKLPSLPHLSCSHIISIFWRFSLRFFYFSALLQPFKQNWLINQWQLVSLEQLVQVSWSHSLNLNTSSTVFNNRSTLQIYKGQYTSLKIIYPVLFSR